MTQGIKNKVNAITGANDGPGEACTLHLARRRPSIYHTYFDDVRGCPWQENDREQKYRLLHAGMRMGCKSVAKKNDLMEGGVKWQIQRALSPIFHAKEITL
jgi:hypothetical protein